MTKILYIEDNLDTAEAVRLILNNAGFQTETANDAKEGIKKAQKSYDIVLLDIMLPDMSGWDIFANLNKKMPNTKFAFLSAIPVSVERMDELRKAGVSGYITKPFGKTDLIEKIKRMVAQ